MYGAVIKLIGGGIQGGLSGMAANDTRDNILSAYSNPPDTPDLKNEYINGYFDQLKDTPGIRDLEDKLRQHYLNQDTGNALDLYRMFGPAFANTTRNIFNKIDPSWSQGRDQLYHTVSDDLAAGSNITPDMQSQIEGYIRGGQTARGNYLGNAPVAAEAFAKGSAGEALKQTRISNMQRFLAGPTMMDKIGGPLGGGGAALGSSLATAVNPGYSYIEGPHDWGGMYENAAQTEFGDNLDVWKTRAAAQAQAGPQVNPWLSSLAGASGAISGMSGGFGGGGGSSGGGGGGGMSSIMSMFGGGGGGGGMSMGGLGF